MEDQISHCSAFVVLLLLSHCSYPGLLGAKLFQQSKVEHIVDELRESAFNKFGFYEHIEGIINADNTDLQKYVRTQFLCIPRVLGAKPSTISSSVW